MITRRVMKCFAILPLLFFVLSQGYSQQASSQKDCYPNAPQVLVDVVKKVATDIVSSNDADKLGSLFSDIFLYTVADAVDPTDEDVPLRTLAAYQYLGETARTDKHIGATAKSLGSTSIMEKPGFAQLLSYAIEHGAIQQEVSSTGLTLSTSPYAFFAMVRGDTAETYKEAGFLKRIGASTTFNISNQNSVLENVNRKQLTEWSIRARLYGDRSTRSEKFQKFWTKEIKPHIQRRLNEITGAHSLIGDDENLEVIRRKMVDPARLDDPESKELSLRDKIADYLKNHTSETMEKKNSEIEGMILCHMKKFLFDPIRKGEIKIDHQTRLVINTDVIPSLVEAHKELGRARQLLDRYLTQFNKGPLLTLAFTNHLTTIDSGYSDFKLLFEQDVRPVKVVANAWVSVYHNPDSMINQERVRDYGVAVSFEGKTNNPFATSAPDLNKVIYSFSGRYQRMKENEGLLERKADIVVVQFKLELPIAMGISLPFSVTYASATEMNKEKVVRSSFGVNFDVDKLFALTRGVLKR